VSTSPTAAYVHVPFCRHRCGYCDFTLIAGRDDLVPAYLRGLERELRFHATDQKVGRTTMNTLFFGGGTPTHPAPDDLAKLLQIVRDRFDLAEQAEVSVEANPLDLTEDKLQILIDHGVNRISLGVQSFHDHELQQLERDHTSADLARIIPLAQSFVPNLSVDLIFGIPGQSLAAWEESLQHAIDSGATHISTYGLTFEAGTAFETRRKRGQIAPTPEELERDMYAVAMEVLPTAGFEQYEISNFARPGFRCRHNEVYWRGDEYHAYGPGAARYGNRRRETNIRSVLGWLARLERGLSPVADVDELSPETHARELLFLGLRRNAGVDRAAFHQRTGLNLEEFVGDIITRQIDLGTLTSDDQGLRLTQTGRFIADRVITEFL